ncbi:MAG: DUF6265 family protein [Phycisphaerales bacterium]
MKKLGIVALVAGAMASAGGLAAFEFRVESPAVAPAPAEAKGLASLAFLHGTWSGMMGDDWVEETWSAPEGDSIIGMFRWLSAGKGGTRSTTMWELLAITDEAEGPTLRLRHFGKDFMPWKSETSEQGVAAMRASTIEKDRVVFTNAGSHGGLSSVEYARKGGVLHIAVAFKDPARETLRFELERSGGGAGK